jgi:hypothetical protein
MVYRLETHLWELFPTDPNVQLYENVMPLRLPCASLSFQSDPGLQLCCESSSLVEAQQINEVSSSSHDYFLRNNSLLSLWSCAGS